MDRKRILLILGLVIAFLAIVTGMVLFLRSRSAPTDETPLQVGRPAAGGTAAPAPGRQKIPPFTSIEDTPKAPPYVPGQGPPPPIEANPYDPTLGVEVE